MKDDPTAHIAEAAQERVDASLAGLEESTTIPKEVTQEDEGKPPSRPSTPSLDDLRRFMQRTPSDLRDYEYASGPHLEIRCRRNNPTPMLLACSLVSADLLLEQEEEEEEEEERKEEVEEEEDGSTKPPASKKPKLE